MIDSPPLNYKLDSKKCKSLVSPVLAIMQIRTQLCSKYFQIITKSNNDQK